LVSIGTGNGRVLLPTYHVLYMCQDRIPTAASIFTLTPRELYHRGCSKAGYIIRLTFFPLPYLGF
jgi:hypothetical protein